MRKGFIAATLTLALAGTIAFAQEVTYDFDKTARFASYRTYAWVRGTELGDPFSHQRIVSAVDAQLAAKGLAKVGMDAGPDVYVAYHAAVARDRQLTASGTGGYPFGGLRTGSARLQDILTGTLAVDIIDAQTRNVVWRGIASKELDGEAKPEKREKAINKGAEKLLKNYPPPQKEMP
jgi:hypothetical protein